MRTEYRYECVAVLCAHTWNEEFQDKEMKQSPLDTLASFGVPKLEVSVVASRQKLRPVVVEGNVPDGLLVAHVSPDDLPVAINLPQLSRE